MTTHTHTPTTSELYQTLVMSLYDRIREKQFDKIIGTANPKGWRFLEFQFEEITIVISYNKKLKLVVHQSHMSTIDLAPFHLLFHYEFFTEALSD